MAANSSWTVLDRIRYQLLKLEFAWATNVGRFSDGRIQFFWLVIVPLSIESGIHQVMYRYETELVWRVGNRYVLIA